MSTLEVQEALEIIQFGTLKIAMNSGRFERSQTPCQYTQVDFWATWKSIELIKIAFDYLKPTHKGMRKGDTVLSAN